MSISRFMAMDLKNSPSIDKEKIMVWRKDAHYYDFSLDVSEQIISRAMLKFDNISFADKSDIQLAGAREFWEVPFIYPNPTCYLQLHTDALKRVFTRERVTGIRNGQVAEGLDMARIGLIVAGQELHVIVTNSQIDRLAAKMDLNKLHDGQLESSVQFYNADDQKEYEGTTAHHHTFSILARMALLVHTAFEIIAETKATTIEREQIAYPWANKNKAFYTKTTIVKIAMSRVRNKYLKRSEPTGRKMPWGEVRSHFAHWRVTDPNCEHQWRDRTDEGRKFKCDKCGEIKTLRTFPTGRGNKDIGIIKTNYEVSQT